MSEALVVLEGVTRTFEGGRIVALDHLDLSIERGCFAAVTGPSGSGKTTLLNLMGAMDLPTSGRIFLDGERVMDRRSMERVRANKIGFVFQRHNLIPVLSARDNVAVALVPEGVPRLKRRARAMRALEMVGLMTRAAADVSVLSGGERQRVAVARALVKEPALLLADEPTGNLDSAGGREVMGLLHDLCARTGATLVLVTHNEALCRGCDLHLRMLDGRLEANGANRR